MIACLYYLKCPKTNQIRYVGQTSKRLNKRLQGHFDEYRRDCKCNKHLTHKQNWFRSLGEQYRKITIHLVEETTIEFVDQKEIELIERFRIEGHPLTNIRHGGESRHYHSIETRKKISDSKIGAKNPMFGKRYKQSDETKERIRSSLINKKRSKEFRNKISLTQNYPVVLLNEQLEVVYEFRNSCRCAEFFEYTRGNVNNAIRHKRKIGKGKKQKFWVIRKEYLQEFLNDTKNKIP